MEIVNAEQIKTNIEACIERECENCSYCEQTACKETMLCDTLALITSQEQRIKELTEELDDAKRDTIPKLRLSLERANVMGVEADKKVAELTEENEKLRGAK